MFETESDWVPLLISNLRIVRPSVSQNLEKPLMVSPWAPNGPQGFTVPPCPQYAPKDPHDYPIGPNSIHVTPLYQACGQIKSMTILNGQLKCYQVDRKYSKNEARLLFLNLASLAYV